MVSGKDTDKFAATGLTPEKSNVVDAPYVKEFPLVLECRLLRSVEIGLHTEFIGEILDVKADAAVFGDDGIPDIEKVKPILFAPEGRKYLAVAGIWDRHFLSGRDKLRYRLPDWPNYPWKRVAANSFEVHAF